MDTVFSHLNCTAVFLLLRKSKQQDLFGTLVRLPPSHTFPFGFPKGNAAAAKLCIEGNLLAMKCKHRAGVKTCFSPAFHMSCLHCFPSPNASWLGFGRAEPTNASQLSSRLLQEPTDWWDWYQAPALPGAGVVVGGNASPQPHGRAALPGCFNRVQDGGEEQHKRQ